MNARSAGERSVSTISRDMGSNNPQKMRSNNSGDDTGDPTPVAFFTGERQHMPGDLFQNGARK